MGKKSLPLHLIEDIINQGPLTLLDAYVGIVKNQNIPQQVMKRMTAFPKYISKKHILQSLISHECPNLFDYFLNLNQNTTFLQALLNDLDQQQQQDLVRSSMFAGYLHEKSINDENIKDMWICLVHKHVHLVCSSENLGYIDYCINHLSCQPDRLFWNYVKKTRYVSKKVMEHLIDKYNVFVSQEHVFYLAHNMSSRGRTWNHERFRYCRYSPIDTEILIYLTDKLTPHVNREWLRLATRLNMHEWQYVILRALSKNDQVVNALEEKKKLEDQYRSIMCQCTYDSHWCICDDLFQSEDETWSDLKPLFVDDQSRLVMKHD